MAVETTTTQADESPQDAWVHWQREHADVLERATGPQRVLLEAAVRFVAVIAAQPVLLRAAAYFLLQADMGLTPAQVGAAVGRTDRAMRTVRALAAHEMLDSIWAELGRHRQPRLHPEHAGPIAKYLVDHPLCTQAEVVAFIARELQIPIEQQTLRRFLKAYGLYVFHPRARSRGGACRAPHLVGRTHFGGAFLLLPAALAPSRIVERTLARSLGGVDKARRLAPSLFFRAALGIERVFHFETLDDPGFAILSGGKRVMSRSRLGGLTRAVKTVGVKKLARATERAARAAQPGSDAEPR